MKTVYPAVFTAESAEIGGFSVTFPDLPGCVTQGDTLSEAVAMAQEALGLYLAALQEDSASVPNPSNPLSIHTRERDFLSLVEVDPERYSRKKYVRKNLTIPVWIADAAERKRINFSAVLQEALLAEINRK
ncbi:MAG: type II toxin-antitoxin system HicB family antitoxin [Clostridiales bacterium]|jgi:predicted RNase H-like HicB family nuclease|nr:type II toxin-antitoxin system HicB family antitoxin [Clostridiales bacterium]